MRLSRLTALGLPFLLSTVVLAQQPGTASRSTNQEGDWTLVRNLLDCRSKYQQTLEQLRLYYLSKGDVEKARWAEEELRQYHRISKQAFNLALDVPSEALEAKQNIPEANQLYMQAMSYKDKGATGTGTTKDLPLVERLLAARKEYQLTLEALRKHYISAGVPSGGTSDARISHLVVTQR